MDGIHLYVNSNNRLNPSMETHSNFSIIFNDIPRNVNYNRVVVLDASIPKSFYAISSLTNVFQLTEASTTISITIPEGNYTRKSLATTLTSLLNSNSPNVWSYSCTFPNINNTGDTGKYTFNVSGNLLTTTSDLFGDMFGTITYTSQPSFTFINNLSEVLGFNQTTYTFTAGTLIAPNVCNLSSESTIFIKSDICQAHGDNILQNIVSTGDPSFSNVAYINHWPMLYSKIYHSQGDNVFWFRITDENNMELNTNGINCVFTIFLFRV